MADDSGSIFAKAGFDLPKAAAPTSVAAVKNTAPAPTASSIFAKAGFDVPGSKSAVSTASTPDSNIPKPFTPEESAAAKAAPPAKSTLRQIGEAIDPGDLAWARIKNTYADTVEHFLGAAHAVKEGYNQVRSGDLAPSLGAPEQKQVVVHPLSGNDYTTTQTVYPNASAGGLLKTVGGVLGMAGSPVSGSTNALVVRPTTELTGNPEIGERAGIVANALVAGPSAKFGDVTATQKYALMPSKPFVTAAGTIQPPNALSTVTRGARSVVSPSTRAINEIVDDIGPENVVGAVARLRQNPRLTLADVSDTVRTDTQGLVSTKTPEAQNFVRQAIDNRAASRLGATNTAYTEAMGPAPNVMVMLEGLKQRAREAGQKAIQPALENAKPVDVSPVIAAIDEKLKPGVNPLLDPGSRLPLSAEQEALARFKQQLITDKGEMLYDPKRLHRVQSDIGDQAFQLSKSPDPKDRLLGSQLRNMNEKLIDQIDEAAGGAYRPARAKFKDAKDIHEAWDEGFDVLKNRSGVNGFGDRPEALEDWMKTATPEEVVAKRLAVRADIDQKINGVKNGALAGETVARIPYNQRKIRTLFGDQEGNRLISLMEDSSDEAATNTRIIGQSKTAETLAAQEKFKIRNASGGINPLHYIGPVGTEILAHGAGYPWLGLVGSGAAGGTLMAARKVGQLSDRAFGLEFAKNALATGPARDETINALLSHPDVVRAAKKSTNALAAP